MECFSDALEKNFVQRMIVHLRDDFREQRLAHGIESADLKPIVREGIANAKIYGIVFEDEIERYIEYTLLLGPRFDSKLGWASEILHREDLDGQAKVNAIGDYLCFQSEESQL